MKLQTYFEWRWQYDSSLPPPPYLYNMTCFRLKIKSIFELWYLIEDRLSEFKQRLMNLRFLFYNVLLGPMH